MDEVIPKQNMLECKCVKYQMRVNLISEMIDL